MTIVAHAHPFVIGVDTHARTHTLAVLVAATGELVATDQFPITDAGLDRAVLWAARRTGGELSALWVIEGVASYGARLASTVNRAGFERTAGDVVQIFHIDTVVATHVLHLSGRSPACQGELSPLVHSNPA